MDTYQDDLPPTPWRTERLSCHFFGQPTQQPGSPQLKASSGYGTSPMRSLVSRIAYMPSQRRWWFSSRMWWRLSLSRRQWWLALCSRTAQHRRSPLRPTPPDHPLTCVPTLHLVSTWKQDTNGPCILFPVNEFLFFPYIAQERTSQNAASHIALLN